MDMDSCWSCPVQNAVSLNDVTDGFEVKVERMSMLSVPQCLCAQVSLVVGQNSNAGGRDWRGRSDSRKVRSHVMQARAGPGSARPTLPAPRPLRISNHGSPASRPLGPPAAAARSFLLAGAVTGRAAAAEARALDHHTPAYA